jgi:hypothetical protein
VISVCLLVYGDHPRLAAQALGSIARTAHWPLVADVRIGFNEASQRARQTVGALLDSIGVPVYVVQEESNRNVGKYPLMRRMFYDVALPPLAESLMWFDDDSHVVSSAVSGWWLAVADVAAHYDLVGAYHRIMMRAQQHVGINQQPWCVKPIARPRLFRFMTGGWWLCRSALLKRWGYPFPEIHHNGGDTMLGELAHQQGWQLLNIGPKASRLSPSAGIVRAGIAINAGLDCADMNASDPRGLTKQPWPWQSAEPASTNHQNFQTLVTRLC